MHWADQLEKWGHTQPFESYEMELARQILALFAEHRLGTSTLGLIASACQICILRKLCSCVHCSAEYKPKLPPVERAGLCLLAS